jgi:CubicO group peptidase (beta-lactamase class C family)
VSDDLGVAIDTLAESTAFSGVVRVDRPGHEPLVKPIGLADRGHGVPHTEGTWLAMASGSKGLTALTVVRLVEEGVLAFDTRVRSLLGADLPEIDAGVTVEHLLGHTSGIGDYLDEGAGGDINDYVLARPVHELDVTEAFLPLLDGFPQVFPPGERFAYNNGGFVVLALLAERAGGAPFHDLVDRLVLDRAELDEIAFLRTDELPGTAALGYLEPDGLRTNVFHLPVRGNGDGGAFATVAGIHALWEAFVGGRIVSAAHVAAMTRPRHDVPSENKRYGLGCWVHATTDAVILEGYDAGVSFQSGHDAARGWTWTVMANTSEGAWPMARLLGEAYSNDVGAGTAA